MTTRAEFYIKGRRLLDKPYHLKGMGLPNVYLLNGVSIDIDPNYGKLITIEDIPGLHHAIGLHIVTKPDEMSGEELRFLRKELGLTQEALAHRLRVNVQTVANYEKGKTGMAAAETAVRAMYALHILPPEAQGSVIRNFVDAIMASRPETKLSEQSQRRIAGSWREAGQRKAAA
jgi:transcriptional regulator with XRE-family HTH domain